jgi:hypothetical protein
MLSGYFGQKMSIAVRRTLHVTPYVIAAYGTVELNKHSHLASVAETTVTVFLYKVLRIKPFVMFLGIRDINKEIDLHFGITFSACFALYFKTSQTDTPVPYVYLYYL